MLEALDRRDILTMVSWIRGETFDSLSRFVVEMQVGMTCHVAKGEGGGGSACAASSTYVMHLSIAHFTEIRRSISRQDFADGAGMLMIIYILFLVWARGPFFYLTCSASLFLDFDLILRSVREY